MNKELVKYQFKWQKIVYTIASIMLLNLALIICLDWKCPEECEMNGSCLEIGFKLGSRLRQIVIFTAKTKYMKNEQGKIEF
jgi:hypothetical protein